MFPPADGQASGFWYDAPVKRVLLGALLLAIVVTLGYGVVETRRDRNYRRLIAQGERWLAAGNASGAIEAFSGAVALKTDSMLGYLRRGEAYRLRGEPEAAVRDLLAASALDPTAPRPLELLGDLNASLQRYDRAAARYQAYLSIDDQSPRVLYKLGHVLYRAGQPAEAIAALRKALAITPSFAEASYVLGLCLRETRRHSEALAAFSAAVALQPTLLHAREELADLYERLGKADEHLTQLEALVALDPGPARSVALGLAYSRVGLTDRAVPTLRQASERYPDDAYVSVALGRVWLEAAETNDDPVALGKARDALERAVARDDDNSEALTLLGRALLRASDHVLAERVLQDATRREPIDAAAFFHLAEAAERCGDLEVARQALLNHRTLAGDDPDARRGAAVAERIGTLSMRVGDPHAAALWYRRALEAGAAEVTLLVKLASAEAAAGGPQAARRTLGTALDREPDDAAARALLRAPR